MSTDVKPYTDETGDEMIARARCIAENLGGKWDLSTADERALRHMVATLDERTRERDALYRERHDLTDRVDDLRSEAASLREEVARLRDRLVNVDAAARALGPLHQCATMTGRPGEEAVEHVKTAVRCWQKDREARAAAERRAEEAEGRLARVVEWTHTYGASLSPRRGAADTFGNGMREAKTEVARLLTTHPPQQQTRRADGVLHLSEVQHLRGVLYELEHHADSVGDVMTMTGAVAAAAVRLRYAREALAILDAAEAALVGPQQQTPAPDDEEHRYCDHATPAALPSQEQPAAPPTSTPEAPREWDRVPTDEEVRANIDVMRVASGGSNVAAPSTPEGEPADEDADKEQT